MIKTLKLVLATSNRRCIQLKHNNNLIAFSVKHATFQSIPYSMQYKRPEGIDDFMLRDEPSSHSRRMEEVYMNEKPQDQRFDDHTSEKEKPKSEKRKIFRGRDIPWLVLLVSSLTFSVYLSSKRIVVAEQDLCEWEPELEKQMPSVFCSHVLRAVRDLRSNRVALRKIEQELFPEVTNDNEKNLETKYTVQWVNMKTGETTSVLNSNFVELLKQCDLSCKIDYLMGPWMTHEDLVGSITFLRVSDMTFRAPLQITVSRVSKSDPSSVHSEATITGQYCFSFMKYKNMSETDGKSRDLLLPPSDDWRMSQAFFQPATSAQADHHIVLNDAPQPTNFKIKYQGSRVLTFEKNERQEILEKNYFWVGPINVFPTRTVLNKIVVTPPAK